MYGDGDDTVRGGLPRLIAEVEHGEHHPTQQWLENNISVSGTLVTATRAGKVIEIQAQLVNAKGSVSVWKLPVGVGRLWGENHRWEPGAGENVVTVNVSYSAVIGFYPTT